MDIDDDDFFRRYEAALSIYETTVDKAVDRAFRFGRLPNTNPEQWALTGPTAIGGAFHRQRPRLCWIYPAGVAIEVNISVLQQEISCPETRRKAQAHFYALLGRWRRNRY